jgi:hypothetical protein
MNFQQQLDAAIAAWNSGEVDDEWLFAKFRDQIGQLSPEEAWAQIGETIPKLLSAVNEDTATEIIETILAIARQSMTTELPNEIKSSRDQLQKQFSNYGDYATEQLRQLFRYYRI